MSVVESVCNRRGRSLRLSKVKRRSEKTHGNRYLVRIRLENLGDVPRHHGLEK